MVPSTDSELVCAMDNKKNNKYSNCRDDDALASTWKSQQQIVRPSRISNNNNNWRTTTTTIAFCLHDELMTHFCTFVKIFAIHHFKQCAPLKQKGGQGPRAWDSDSESDRGRAGVGDEVVNANSESLWVPVGALCAASVAQWFVVLQNEDRYFIKLLKDLKIITYNERLTWFLLKVIIVIN